MKRVYKKAEVLATGGGYTVALDGRRVKTPGRRDLLLPTEAMAAAIAEEWNAQTGEIRPATMPLCRLANAAIDRTSMHRDKIVEEIANYAGTDLVCYRAEHPPALTARQRAEWQPLVDWAAGRFDAPLEVTAGVVPRPQPARSLKSLALAVAEHDDFALAALYAATTACGSLVIALALFEGSTPTAPSPPRSSTRATRSRTGAKTAKPPSGAARSPPRLPRPPVFTPSRAVEHLAFFPCLVLSRDIVLRKAPCRTFSAVSRKSVPRRAWAAVPAASRRSMPAAS
jgi:chaperone required for assembly of F1-ATPase